MQYGLFLEREKNTENRLAEAEGWVQKRGKKGGNEGTGTRGPIGPHPNAP